jgi:hypothetical protein
VPEGKVVKNRVHLDLEEAIDHFVVTMQDPEGNEFCVQ